MGDSLIRAHGGALTELMLSAEEAAEAREASRDWPSWDLTPRQLCDLELILNGGFSPLTGFMGKADFESVCQNMRLASGELWPIPITLDVTEEMADGLSVGDRLALLWTSAEGTQALSHAWRGAAAELGFGDALVVGLAGGASGYVTTPLEYRSNTYESRAAVFGEDAGRLTTDALRTALQSARAMLDAR